MGRLSNRIKEEQFRVPIPPKPTTKDDIIANEHKGKLGIINDIKDNPIPKGIATEEIGGVPIDWHELENFVVSISPTKFVNLLKLQKQMIKEYGIRFRSSKPGISGKIILLLLLAIGMGVLGLLVILYLPNILEMFGA